MALSLRLSTSAVPADDFGMDVAYSVLELIVETMNGLPLGALILLSVIAGPPLVLWHELGHGVAALALTRGRVQTTVGADDGPLWFSIGRLHVVMGLLPFVSGGCSYDPDTLFRGRHEALIAAGGPLASAIAAVALMGLALVLGPADELFTRVLVVFAATAALHTSMSLLPTRYALGSGAAGSESDGLAIWRILTGGTGRLPALTYGRATPTESAAHPVFAVVLLLIACLAFFLSPGLGVVVAVFGVAWWVQTSDARAGR